MPWRWRRLRRKPAVSTSRNVVSPRVSTVSIVSRVVPGTSETMTRVSPSSAFRSDDLPTFGRPRIATRIASSPTIPSSRPGSCATTSSSRSPVPWPWRAESGTGSPSPSRWNSTASRSRRGSSILFASTITGLPETRRIVASSSSPGRDPGPSVDDEEDEIGLADRRLRLLGDVAPERAGVGLVDAAGVDQPEGDAVPVGEQLLAVARHPGRLVHDGRPGLGEAVDERRLPDVREADDRDRPGASDRVGEPRPSWTRARRDGVAGAAEPVDVDEPVEEAPDLLLELRPTPPCSRCRPSAARRTRAARPRRSTPAGSAGRGLPGLRAVDRDRDDRHVLLDARPSPRRAAPCRGRRRRWRVPSTNSPSALPSATIRRIVRTASRSDSPRRTGEAAERADERAEARDAVGLDLRHVVEDARARGAEHDGVEPAEMVRRDHDAALARHTVRP